MPILCGTDFSQTARAAVDAAAAVARRGAIPLTLVHATGRGVQLAALPDTSQGLHDAAYRRAQRQQQLEALVAWGSAQGVETDGIVDDRGADVALLERSAADDVPLVVVGAVGHTALERLVLGSTAERVAMAASKPVLVVRDVAAWRAWDDGQRPLRVAIAFDTGVSARAALAWGVRLAAMGDVHLTACWVVHPALENERHGVTGAGAGVALLPATLDALTGEMSQRTFSLTRGRPLALQLEANLGRVDRALIDWAQRDHSDLMVVGSHQRQGFERLWHTSVSRGILHHAPMSVAVVPLAGTSPVGAPHESAVLP